MKFNRRNRLIKVLFILFLAVACFSIDNVRAEKATLTCEYEFDDKTTDILFIENSKAKSKRGAALMTGGNPEVATILEEQGKCPEPLYKVVNSKTMKTSYFANADDVGTFEKSLSLQNNYNHYSSSAKLKSSTKCDDGAEALAQVDALMKKMTEEKKQGNGGWSSDGDEIAKSLNQYVNDSVKNKSSFCDEETITTIVEAMKIYNDAVSKDPNAPQNSKNTIKSQTEKIEENAAILKKYTLSNKTNIELPPNENLNKCEDLISEDLMYVINLILRIIQIGGPILLIILVAVDFGQVVISNDKDAMPKAVSKAIKRGIAAIVIFFVPYFVSLILDWLNNYSSITGAGNCIK